MVQHRLQGYIEVGFAENKQHYVFNGDLEIWDNDIWEIHGVNIP